jgi:hypothetical protein
MEILFNEKIRMSWQRHFTTLEKGLSFLRKPLDVFLRLTVLTKKLKIIELLALTGL